MECRPFSKVRRLSLAAQGQIQVDHDDAGNEVRAQDCCFMFAADRPCLTDSDETLRCDFCTHYACPPHLAYQWRDDGTWLEACFHCRDRVEPDRMVRLTDWILDGGPM